MPRPEPAVSLCELAFPYTTFEQDVAICGRVGAAGMSIDERKLVGDDEQSLRLFRQHGLRAAVCATNTLYLLPMEERTPTRPDPGPPDPEARIAALCAGIRRLAAFDPDEAQWQARLLVERLALALQASLLVRHAPPAVADAFCSGRLEGGGRAYGTLPPGIDAGAIIERALAA